MCPWLSLWESCQPNRLTERVLRLMVGKRVLERGPSQAAPAGGSQLSQRESQGRFAPFHDGQNTIQRNTQKPSGGGRLIASPTGAGQRIPPNCHLSAGLQGALGEQNGEPAPSRPGRGREGTNSPNSMILWNPPRCAGWDCDSRGELYLTKISCHRKRWHPSAPHPG